MNYSTAVFLINKNLRAVTATYEAEENAKRTLFKTLDQTLTVGDFVVVQTDTRHKMTVCRITEVDVDVDFDSQTRVDWIVGKVDAKAHVETLAQEQAAIQAIKSAELRTKRETLRDSMLANHVEGLKTLAIADMGAATPEAKPAAE